MHGKIASDACVETVAHFVALDVFKLVPGAEAHYVVAQNSCSHFVEDLKFAGLRVLKRSVAQMICANSQEANELYQKLKPAERRLEAGCSSETNAAYHKHKWICQRGSFLDVDTVIESIVLV